MNPLRRPSTVLALVVTAVSTTGCFWFGCGDTTFEDREMVGEFDLEADGTVALWDDSVVDPLTDEGCARLCEEVGYGSITEVSSCEAELFLVEDGDTGAPGDSGDSGESGSIVEITCIASGQDFCVGGRHTGTLVHRAHGTGVDAVAAWLAREAAGEAGSVLAFRQLVRELKHHGAPKVLVEDARQAAADEVRHARMVRLLAQRRGGTPDAVEARPTPPRDLFEVALENAIEGCVHETFAAARAAWQARHAADRDVRAVSALLARDEARHADLAAAVHDWMMVALPPEQAAVVEAERRAAWARLASSPPAVAPEAVRELGLPDAAQHRALVAALSAELLIQAA